MKKSLIALAALGAFAGAASAQSSVTLYGRVDLSIQKPVGTDQKGIANGSGSRFGVRGVEDLGGGLKGIFQIEHRYNADTGAMSDASRMWGGRSIVGASGGFGQVLLGREYTTAFLMSQLVADPWGWDTVAANLTSAITGGAIARVRNDSSITYNVGGGGFGFGFQMAEATDTINKFQKKPMNFAVNYRGGPLSVGLGYERTGQEAAASAKWTTFNAAYNLGGITLGGFYGTGNTAANADHRSYMLTAKGAMGAGEWRAAYGKLENKTANVDAAKGFALGYHYSLSKRTTLYTDFVRNTGVLAGTEKTGYDFGIKHNF